MTDLIVAKDTANPGDVYFTYTPVCNSIDNKIVVGDLDTEAYIDEWCDIGNSGAYHRFVEGADSLFFLVVADDGSHEGSYGKTAMGEERIQNTAAPVCPRPQDLPQRCD